MAATTVDYMVSIVIVIGLLATSTVITGQTLNTALVYQQDQQTSIEASSILNNIFQSPGEPLDWGVNTTEPSAFGLRWLPVESVMTSPFTPMRLMRTGETTLYNNVYYRNLSTVDGLNLFLKEDDYVDYDTVSELLAVNGSYGFKLTIEPILTVNVSQIETDPSDPLKLGIAVNGLSGPLSGATLNATLFYYVKDQPYPSIKKDNMTRGAVSNMSGEAEIEFEIASETPYFALVRGNLAGLSGVGYCTNAPSGDSLIIPIITDYEDGKVSLVHIKDVIPSSPTGGELNYNLTFILPVGNSEFHSTYIANSSGKVKQGEPGTVSLSVGNPGILLISFRLSAAEYGLTAMPWGISPLGLSLTFGGDPSYKKTVVTKSLNTAINKVTYQVELALWRLKG